ncbi:glycosyltransferase family 4 protein [Mesorhizobium sp. M0898]|uniref:glycosyltransferase family 4 protein n=1 Tax=Mesorhizobium sp. M0898 TaxID=2957020 RepID=UPI00333BEB92
MTTKVVVQQIGARMDYAVARGLHNQNMLAKLVTDLHLPKWIAEMSGKARRYESGMEPEVVSSSIVSGFLYKAFLRAGSGAVWPHIFAAEAIAPRTVKAVRETKARILYGYDTALLPVIPQVQELGCDVVLEQCIAPRRHLIEQLPRLSKKLAEIGISQTEAGIRELFGYLELLSAIEQSEWRGASLIVCPSEFVKDELVKSGVPPERIVIIPYGVNVASGGIARKPVNLSGMPKVAFVGGFSYRKGAIEYCRLAERYAQTAEFHCFGTVMIPEKVMRGVSGGVVFRGHLSREHLFRELAGFDILVLPSYSEGSATVIYECMALGLVCVVSKECGSVIRTGIDGVVFDAGDDEGLYSAFEEVASSPNLRAVFAREAEATSRRYTREGYGLRVTEAINLFRNTLQ